jgi:hypothetical protein
MIKINQLKIQTWWDHFKNGTPVIKRCNSYSDSLAPSFFFSCNEISWVIDNHKGPAIIILNNDPRPLEACLDKVRLRKDIYFISTSLIISNYLDRLKLSYIEFPFGLADRDNIKPIKKGNSIYFYGQGPMENLYGYPTIKRIVKNHFPHLNIICTQFGKYNSAEVHPPFKAYSKSELEDVYKKCFIGIRLTEYDGLSSTVQDLGVRGIKTIWNGGTPSALPYQSEDDIINHIRNEEKLIGQTDLSLSNEVKTFLDMNRKEYDYIFDLNTYIRNDQRKLFKNLYKIPAILFSKILQDANNLNKKITIK